MPAHTPVKFTSPMLNFHLIFNFSVSDRRTDVEEIAQAAHHDQMRDSADQHGRIRHQEEIAAEPQHQKHPN